MAARQIEQEELNLEISARRQQASFHLRRRLVLDNLENRNVIPLLFTREGADGNPVQKCNIGDPLYRFIWPNAYYAMKISVEPFHNTLKPVAMLYYPLPALRMLRLCDAILEEYDEDLRSEILSGYWNAGEVIYRGHCHVHEITEIDFETVLITLRFRMRDITRFAKFRVTNNVLISTQCYHITTLYGRVLPNLKAFNKYFKETSAIDWDDVEL